MTTAPPRQAAGAAENTALIHRLALSARQHLPAAGILAGVAGAWEAASLWLGVPGYILPSLNSIWSTAVMQWRGTLASATAVTTLEVLLGFALSVVVALAIGFALHISRMLRDAIYPLLIGSQAVPIVVIAPVLAIIFGYSLTPKLLVVALICFFPIVVNTVDGLGSVEPELLRVMRTLDGGRWATLTRIEAPAALPSIFSGLRIAATYAPIGAVFGEYSGSQNGLGYVMIQAIPQLETALVFAAIFILTGEAVVLFIAISLLERLACPWARKGKQ
ncbi:MAG TPA: ABC transporter permease [Streptosporangiaceae bacterium]|nr:ABC transporter permease [Streptosporangiaceae bacterium]